MNDKFYIKGLGEFEYVVTLLSIDYPETFVARKTSDELELFIFDEVENNKESVTWVCSAISVDDLDALNKGTKTLNSCFIGPRRTPKPGYLVTSYFGKEQAEYKSIDNMSPFVSDIDVYVPQFVEDKHGTGVLALATKKVLFSLVINENKYADPFIDITRLTDSTNSGKAFLTSLPYNIEIRKNKACIQSNQSVVINFEITDKKDTKNSKQLHIKEVENATENVESIAAAEAIELALNSGNDENKLISALGNNKKSLKSYNRFVSSISKNKKDNQIIQIAKPNGASNVSINISKESLNSMANVAKESIKIMNEQKKQTGNLKCVGYFEMFDLKGKGRFRFICDDGRIYRGTKSSSFDSKSDVIELKDSDSKYLIYLECSSYRIDGKDTDLTYELVSAEKEKKPFQNELSFND